MESPTWLLEERSVLPDELTGFRQRRGTADALGDLCSTLEDAKFNQKMMHIVVLHVCHAVDSFRDATILDQLRETARTQDRVKDKGNTRADCQLYV